MGADLYINSTDGEKGYFRDSYNNSNLLWKFDLSYWKNPYISKTGKLSPTNAKRLLKAMKKKKDIFDKNMSKEDKESISYFKDKYKKFKAFLNLAIKLKESIDCSY